MSRALRVALAAALVTGASLAGAHADLLGGPAGCASSDWRMFQHDASHTADASASCVTRLDVNLLHPGWFVSTGGMAVTAEPTVANRTVYVGDGGGSFYAIDASSHAIDWTFRMGNKATNVCGGSPVVDQHQPSYGEITSSAAYVDDARVGAPTVFVGAGGTLYALHAADGSCAWAQDLDPSHPTSRMEVESSPVYDPATGTVIVGSDANEATGAALGKPGVQAFDAATGALAWKFQPEDVATVHTLTGDATGTDGCGDVWSSPALDADAMVGTVTDGLVFFGTGNCNHPESQTAPGALTQAAVWAIDATTGSPVWHFVEPDNIYVNATDAAKADDDFGASPVVDRPLGLVIAASKSGFVYGLDETTGRMGWSTQAAQPGNLGTGPGAVGGVIGSPALGQANGADAVFVTSAIFGPFSGTGLPAANPDTSLAGDPARVASVHALDAASGRLLWHASVSTPAYAPATYASGIVFAPLTTGFGVYAYDADTGVPLWRVPIAAAASSGVSIAGTQVFFGGGTTEGTLPAIGPAPATGLPPQVFGIWSLTTALAGA